MKFDNGFNDDEFWFDEKVVREAVNKFVDICSLFGEHIPIDEIYSALEKYNIDDLKMMKNFASDFETVVCFMILKKENNEI